MAKILAVFAFVFTCANTAQAAPQSAVALCNGQPNCVRLAQSDKHFAHMLLACKEAERTNSFDECKTLAMSRFDISTLLTMQAICVPAYQTKSPALLRRCDGLLAPYVTPLVAKR